MRVDGDRLYERAEQLDSVEQLARRASGGNGCVGLVEAPAGFGKSALLDAAAARNRNSGFRVLRARGSELERAYPYGIVRQLLDRVLSDRHRAPGLTGASAAAARLFDPAAIAGSDAAADVSPFPMLNGLYWTVADLSDEAPLALLIDDAHEADDASLRFVSYLSGRVADLPVLLLLAARPSAENPSQPLDGLRADPAVERIALKPLSLAAVTEVAGARLGQPCEPEFVQACHTATGGNPFYLFELLRELAADGVTPVAANAPSPDGLAPPVIVRSLLFRMASMPASALPLARACAVLGDDARLADCAQLAQLDVDDAAVAADLLAAADVFRPGAVAFAHPILQAAVLTDLGTHERARWHGRAAWLLAGADADPQVIGMHLLRTEPTGDPRTVEVLWRAGQGASAMSTPRAAATFFRRALVEPATGSRAADLLFQLGVAEATIGEPSGLEHLRKSISATGDPRLRAERTTRLADFQMRSGRVGEVVGLLAEALAELNGADPELALRLRTTRYWIGRQHRETFADAMSQLPELRRAVDGPDTPARRQLLTYLAAEAAHGDSHARACAMIDRALAAPGLLTFTAIDSIPSYVALLTLCALERFADFDLLADRVSSEAGERGKLLGFLVVSTFRSLALLRRGLPAAAEAEASAALEAAQLHGWRIGAASLVALHAVALLEQGRVDEAQAVLASDGELDIPPGFPTAMMSYARGQLLVSQGELAAGIAALRHSGGVLDTVGMHSPGIVPWREQVATAHLAAGQLAEAGELAAEELQLAQRVGGPIAIGRAQRVLGLVTGGATGIDLLREAVRSLEGTGSDLARASVDLGAALRRAGSPSLARDYLLAGLDLASRLQCHGIATLAHEELLAAGARPRRVYRSGPDALTPSEQRIARMAARGMSNVAIAQTLFVSRKTVEKHLGSVFRKLGVSSRAELEADHLDDPSRSQVESSAHARQGEPHRCTGLSGARGGS